MAWRFLLCQPALAGPYEDAAAAYMRRSYTEALQLWLPLAEQGNAAAQYNLGAMYENGQGVPRDNAEAEKWYRLAAGQGLADAQFTLGVRYENGQGVPQNIDGGLEVVPPRRRSGVYPGPV